MRLAVRLCLLRYAARAMRGLLPLLTARQPLSRASTCAQALVSLTSEPVPCSAFRGLCQHSDARRDLAHYELINGDRLFPSTQEESMQARISAVTTVAAPGERYCWSLVLSCILRSSLDRQIYLLSYSSL